MLLGAASLIMGMVFARFGAGGRFAGEPPNLRNLRRLAGLPSLWIMTVLFSLSIGASIGLYTMIPLYLVVGRGWEHNWANTVVSASRVGAMLTAVVGGLSVDRLGRKRAMGCFLVATGLSTIWMGLAPDRWMLVAACLQPMLAVCFFPAGFATISQIVPARLRSVSISLVILVGILIGAGLTPSFLGWLAERQAFHLGFVALGVLIVASAALLTGLRFPSE